MKNPFDGMPLGWRIFITTSITITILFAAAGWRFQQYAISEADENVRAEIQASVQAYEAVWKARTEVLSATSSFISGMSDVRAAFLTRDPQTIRDSAQDLWSRVSDSSALFFVLTPKGIWFRRWARTVTIFRSLQFLYASRQSVSRDRWQATCAMAELVLYSADAGLCSNQFRPCTA